ncbi:MAG: hypothetical protein AB1414_12790 [bacterium]
MKEKISLEQCIEELEDMFLREKEEYLYEFILQALEIVDSSQSVKKQKVNERDKV